jgi:glutamyl-tRNA synthetase
MILGPDGAKLSKRHGAVDIREYREQGYLPEAVLNYLVRLGWSHGDQEIFSIEDMIRLFDIADVNQSASSFNPTKLLWLNQQHIIAAPAERLEPELLRCLDGLGLDTAGGPDPKDVVEAYRERAETMQQMAQAASYCYEDFDEIDAQSVKKHLRPVILEPLRAARNMLAELDNWSPADIADVIETVSGNFEINMGKLGQPIRVAVTGGSVSPPIDITVWLVGQDRAVQRLDHAIELVEMRAESA